MRKKDVLELKRRLKKEDCTFTKICGCYVDAEKNIVLNFNRTFLTLEDDEFFKYLEIAKKTLSGTIGNNLLELEFPYDSDSINERQQFLLELKKSKLKDENLLEKFYYSIIDNYEYTGNYLIVIFHDAYDVITKTTDNLKLDESEEVYEYILCAICPVSLSKPGLSYFEEDNRIGVRIRDWIVDLPNLGFLYPAFTDRSTDVNSVMYYSKNPKDTHPELMEGALGCPSKSTATEQKIAFTSIIENAVGDKSENVLMEIHDSINTMIEEHNSMNDDVDAEPVVLTNDAILDILADSGVSEEISTKIEKSFIDEFGDELPIAEHILDSKVLSANEQRKKEKRLERQVEILQNKLERKEQEITLNEAALDNDDDVTLDIVPDNVISDEDNNDNNDILKDNDNVEYDVVLKVKPEKVPQIKSEIIDGKKCLIIPMEEDEHAKVNPF